MFSSPLPNLLIFCILAKNTCGHNHLKIPLTPVTSTTTTDATAETDVTPLQLKAQGQFLGQLGIGSPPQYFNVLFDTGSSNTWVWSTKCTSDACATKNRFDATHSLTFHPDVWDKQIHIGYGSGKIEASVGSDVFTVGANNRLVVQAQTFGAVFAESGAAFELCEMDGIVGLAFPEMSVSDQPLFEGIMHENHLQHPVFSFALYDAPYVNLSHITFGTIDPTLFEGDELMTANVQGKRYWEIKTIAIKVNGQAISTCSPESPCKVAIDSGTGTVSGPPHGVNELNALLQIDPNCMNYDRLPTIEFTMESANKDEGFFTLELPGRRVSQKYGLGNSRCASSLLGLDVPPPRGPLWVLGAAFFKEYFVSFNRRQRTVGFATMLLPPVLSKGTASMADAATVAMKNVDLDRLEHKGQLLRGVGGV